MAPSSPLVTSFGADSGESGNEDAGELDIRRDDDDFKASDEMISKVRMNYLY